MAIIRWMPQAAGPRSIVQEMDRMRRQMDALVGSLAGQYPETAPQAAGVYPLLNVSEDQDHLFVTAELPGMNVADLDLTIEKDNLIIRGERKIETAEKKVNYHRREREAGTFRRVISLPVRVDAGKVSAIFRDGVLEVTLPKAAEAKPRQIAIQAA